VIEALLEAGREFVFKLVILSTARSCSPDSEAQVNRRLGRFDSCGCDGPVGARFQRARFPAKINPIVQPDALETRPYRAFAGHCVKAGAFTCISQQPLVGNRE